MTISRLIKCEDCGESFWHKVERRSDPNPDECPLCHNTGDVVVLDMKGLLSPKIAQMVEEGRGPATSMLKARAVDGVYRGMESSSAARSELAAADLGIDPSETAHLKITDLKDNLKFGDIAAKLPTPNVAAMGPNVATFHQKPETATGQVMGPGSMGGFGEAQRQRITGSHAQRARQLVRAGEAGRYVAPK